MDYGVICSHDRNPNSQYLLNYKSFFKVGHISLGECSNIFLMNELWPYGLPHDYRPVDQNSNPAKSEKPNREDDDVNSTTS